MAISSNHPGTREITRPRRLHPAEDGLPVKNHQKPNLLDWILILAAAGIGLLTSAGILSLRYALLSTAILLVTALGRGRSTLAPRFLAGLTLSIGVAGLLQVIGKEQLRDLYALGKICLLVGLILTTTLAVWNRESKKIENYSSWWGLGAVATLILIAGATTTFIRLRLGSPLAFTPDENIYAFQATYSLVDFRGVKIEEWLEPFFRIRQTFVRDGFLSGQYAPGWPALLGLLRIVGLAEIAGYVMYSCALIALASWVRMLRGSWEIVALAVALTASSYEFFFFNTSFFSHGFSTLLGLLAAMATLTATRHQGLKSGAFWVLAGAAISLLACVRPLNGVVGLLLFFAWMIYSKKIGLSSIFGSSLGLLLCGVPLLIYNHVSTGHALRFGYELAQNGLQRPGFGERGSVGFTDAGTSFSKGWDFTPFDGILNFCEIVGGSLLSFWPGGLFFLLLAAAIDRKQLDWRASAPWVIGCLAMPVAYAFYAFGDPRMVIDILPFAIAGSALWAGHSLRHDPRMTRTLIWATVFLGACMSAGRLIQLEHHFETRRPYIEMVEEVRKENGPLLVFVEEAASFSQVEHGLETLFWFNARPEKDVVVGRHVAQLRPYIIGHYPHHQPILFRAGIEVPGGRWAPARIELIESESEKTAVLENHKQ